MEFAVLRAIFIIIAFLQQVGAQHGGMGGMSGGGSSGSIDGGWASWKPWSTCPVTCGGGVQNRSRTCTKPPPAHGGEDCQGDGLRTRSCNENPCPVDGVWSPWTRLSSCTRTCAGGVERFIRYCSSPPPKNGGKNCEGYSRWTQYCNQAPCPGKRQSVNTRRGTIGGSIGAVVFCVIVVIVCWKKRTQRGHN